MGRSDDGEASSAATVVTLSPAVAYEADDELEMRKETPESRLGGWRLAENPSEICIEYTESHFAGRSTIDDGRRGGSGSGRED